MIFCTFGLYVTYEAVYKEAVIRKGINMKVFYYILWDFFFSAMYLISWKGNIDKDKNIYYLRNDWCNLSEILFFKKKFQEKNEYRKESTFASFILCKASKFNKNILGYRQTLICRRYMLVMNVLGWSRKYYSFMWFMIHLESNLTYSLIILQLIEK